MIIATLWAVSLTILLIVGAWLAYATQLPRLVPINDLNSPNAYDPSLAVETDRERFQLELAPVVAKLDTTEAKVIGILRWLMNQIPKVDGGHAKSSWKMVEMGRSGGGLICGGMAQIFHDVLIAHGIPARRVLLQRNVFDVYDTHVTVEAFVDGKWRMYDPTFHIALKSNGSRIGVYEARSWLLNGVGNRVEIEFLGDVSYPARINMYPIRYEALINNVYIELKRSHGIIRAIPIFGVWLGPQWGYKSNDGLSSMAQNSYRFLYYITLMVLPLINLILLLSIGFLSWKARFFRQ